MADKTVDQVEKTEQRLYELWKKSNDRTVSKDINTLSEAYRAAKRYFYTRWLPDIPYRAKNIEYEHHTEKSLGRHPEIELFFAVEKKTETEDRHGTAKQ